MRIGGVKCRAAVIGAVLELAVAGCGSGGPEEAPAPTVPNPHMAVPAVTIGEPVAGSVVRRAFTVSGTASGPAVTIELLRGGKAVAKRTVTATPQGTFSATFRSSPGSVTIVALTTKPRRRVDLPVTVSP